MNYETSIMRLDDQQLDAVMSNDSRIVIEAVPGSGKTTTIVSKVAYLVKEEHINPKRIVMMTYTKTAVADIKRRMQELFEDINLSDVTICTLHSFAYKIMTTHRNLCHLPQPTVADENNVRRLMREIVKQETPDHRWLTDEELTNIETCAEYYKNLRHSPKKDEPMAEFFDLYQTALHQLGPNIIDYSDILLYAMMVAEKAPTIVDNIRSKYDFWLIDEAQDCSPLQHKIIAALTKDSNVIFVGDADQSVYGFRAAKPELLEKIIDQPNTTTLRIESNYRSGTHICNVANAFLSHDNTTKHIRPQMANKGTITFAKEKAIKTEYETVLDFINSHDGDSAILYRNNDLAFPLIQYLSNNDIDFTIRNPKTTMLTSRPIRDALAFLKLSENPSDPEAFMQVYARLNIFATRQQAQATIATARPGRNLFMELSRNLPKKFNQMRAWDAGEMIYDMTKMRPTQLFEYLLKSKYKTYLEEYGGAFRIRILANMSRKTHNYNDVCDMLDNIKSTIKEHSDNDSTLTLSTIHSAKGLEWDNVAVIDMNDGIFPAPQSQKPALEVSSDKEERNLMYVAMTRPRNNLLLASSSKKISSFMSEIQLMDLINKTKNKPKK